MGVNRKGRFAAITNVRESGMFTKARLSRGKLPQEFLAGDEPPETFVERIGPHAEDYAGFNLLIGDSAGLLFYSNRQAGLMQIADGVHGVSNGLFDENWPKLVSGKQALATALETRPDKDELMQILTDNTIAHDHHLPDTGVALEVERMLSSRFIRSADYGTRACSVVMFNSQDSVSFVEQNYIDAETIGVLVLEQFEIVA